MRRVNVQIIGAQKCGTTTVFDWLDQHPDVYVPDTKEIHFFAREEFWKQGPGYLANFYAGLGDEAAIAGAYVHTMYFPESVARMHSYNPSMKLIAVLRDPVSRAYSAYWYARKNGWETLPTFELALEAEDARARGSRQEQAELTYLRHGYYAEQLRPWRDTFGAEQLRVIETGAIRSRPAEVLADLCAWIGVDERFAFDTSERSNTSAMPRFPRIHRALLSDNAFKRAVRRYTSPRLRLAIQRKVISRILKRNQRPFTYPPILPETRERLAEHFAPHNAALADEFGVDVSRWAQPGVASAT
ncbi:MAG: hypothetical protein EP330_05820 [Deltaproteobacteria bacterium]|nr:MAG: hypothetical protein EP330_05820 [Deltaproteobacteria bacterium]